MKSMAGIIFNFNILTIVFLGLCISSATLLGVDNIDAQEKSGQSLESAVAWLGGEAGPAERIKAFCVDFNWGAGGPNGFSAPGLFSQADPAEHYRWYRALGVNVIQTFAVSCNGYAWFRDSAVAPVQPGLKDDFLKEITALAHRDGVRVMGYFCVGANTYWGQAHPDESYGVPNGIHIPFTKKYNSYLADCIRDALLKTSIDGFMLDWVFSPPLLMNETNVRWLPEVPQNAAQVNIRKNIEALRKVYRGE